MSYTIKMYKNCKINLHKSICIKFCNMSFNRLNTNTNAHQRTDSVCYVHKKFGVIKETKLKMQDGVTNPSKRFKVEALKSKTSDTNGPGKKAIIVETKTETKIKNKPLDMPDLSSLPLTSRQTKVKRIKPLKGPSRPVLDNISEKPLHPMVEPRIKRIEPLKGPCRSVPQPLQQQQPRGPAVLRKYLDDISAMPPKPLQAMVEPCFKRIEPLKGPFRPVPLPLQQQLRGPPMLGKYLNDVSAMPPKPMQPMVEPCINRIEPLKGPFRPVTLPLQQQQLRGPPILGMDLNDVSAMPPKPLQPMVEPRIKWTEPLKGPFRPVPLPLQQQRQLRGPPMLGNYLDDISAMPPKPLKGPFRSVPLPLQQPLKGPFRPVPLPLQKPLKGPFRSVPLPLQQPLKRHFRPVPLPFQQPLKGPFKSLLLLLHQQQISVLEKKLEDLKKMYDQNFKLMCKIRNSEPNMTIRHLTNTTLRSANKENLIKKPKEKFVESDSKEAPSKKSKKNCIRQCKPQIESKRLQRNRQIKGNIIRGQ